MPDLLIDPPIPRAKSHDPFLQTLTLTIGNEPIARARWLVSTAPAQGVVQLLDLTVHPDHRRQGHAHRLMEAVTQQAQTYFKTQKSRLRRIWTSIEQKNQILARSFLMQFGFNHVGTISELLKDEDLLIYMRTFD
jgi:ribosomal protein S18 acetylase RimI-like enzyme